MLSIAFDETFFALVVGFIMAWAIGANDVANAMASTVGARILSIRQAVIVAAIFEALGAMFASGQVTNMIRFGIVDIELFAEQPQLFVIGMFAALLSASTWLIFATHYGLPVSTTHTIIGAVLGFGLVSVGPWNIEWQNLFEIFLSWILSPCIATLMSYMVFKYISKYIFNAQNRFQAAARFIPKCTALVSIFFINITLLNGLAPLGIRLSSYNLYTIVLLGGILAYSISAIKIRQLTGKYANKKQANINEVQLIEDMFSGLAIISAATMAFAHGANDVANAIGPVAAIISVLGKQSIHTSEQASVIPFWLLQLGAAGVVLGLVTYGYRIMETVGSKITQLTPSRGFAAQLTTSVIIIVASALGMPVSTTQIMVGSILGIGLAKGLMAINLGTVRSIFVSWSITIPAGAILSGVYFFILKHNWGL